ncbi:helix-turn-helix transcriptional regulator [Streptomyces sp. S.PB5]|uniref:helix-turn-helix domain-containing protein n=1 Tax=Streptomyces sp. S.PB5 TaxID=3020844 RepID=UPI0025B147F6|nr:helix-turn-helix transcriptional regulator [Streptomyces sp. S.PB5]MDN3023606.1 helix-turn-helix transcriptional regulator [Streptomyces sp. S.PB5]
MTGRAGHHEPLSNEQRYGDELRRRREAAGLTQAELAERVVCSPSLIAHYEAGRRTPSHADAQRLDQVLGTDGFFTRWRKTLAKSRFAEHFQEAAEAEQLAVFIEEYAVSLVPGLLQTRAYARAVFRGFRPHATADDVDKKVVNRLERARILEHPETPRVWAILHESVIRTLVGSPEVMTEQLRHIAQLGRSGRVLVQVVPFSAGIHATMNSMVSLMRFADAPDMAYVEALHTGSLTDEPSLVRRYRDAYDLTRAAALPPEASLDLIESVAEDYGNHERPPHP